jgi:hypothetical protein
MDKFLLVLAFILFLISAGLALVNRIAASIEVIIGITALGLAAWVAVSIF